MAVIRGFRGWRYNAGKVGDLTAVMAPPYDVISKKDQQALHRKSPFNVVRLILGKDTPKDTVSDNKYTRAHDLLDAWKGQGVMIQEAQPAFYVYVQDYKESGRLHRRIGFMAAMRLDKNAFLRHENTLAAPKKDRMALLKEVKTNLSPIFGLFEDPKGQIQNLLRGAMTSRPAVDVRIEGVRHRVFIETKPGVIRALCGLMRPRPLFIADGHHRFEVACQFQKFMRAKAGPGASPEAGWNYAMVYLSDCLHNPFTIYPTHRLLSLPAGIKKPLELLSRRGRLEPVSGLTALLAKLSKPRRADEPYRFGVFTKKDRFRIFTLDKKYVQNIKKNPVERLDVAVLHRQIIEPCFNVKAIEKSEQIDFTRDAGDAYLKVRQGLFDAAIFLRPTSLEDMILVSKKGLKMPQKSTYFYPKLLSGLVFHALAGSADGT